MKATAIMRADLGQATVIDATAMSTGSRLIAISRQARTQLMAGTFSLWFQLRGTTSIDAREGRFRLDPGDWIALDPESQPAIQASRNGLVLGLVVLPHALSMPGRALDHALFPGRGHCPKADHLITLRVWRETARWLQSAEDERMLLGTMHLDPLLTHLSSLQRDIGRDFDRCPGKSGRHKAKVFVRLQRARLFLEGNCDRIVGLDELARLTNFSRWYLSKTFQTTYGERLMMTSRRTRIERACKLLAETSLSIYEVAARCGFENPCSFARAFRSETGTTSTLYRESRHRGLERRPQRQTPTTARMPGIAALNLSLR